MLYLIVLGTRRWDAFDLHHYCSWRYTFCSFSGAEPNRNGVFSSREPHVKVLPSVPREEMCVEMKRKKKKNKECKRLQLLENEDRISLVTSAVQIFPSVSIATATSHSLTEQSMTHRLVTNKNCNESLWQKAGSILGILQQFIQTNAMKKTDMAVIYVVTRQD